MKEVKQILHQNDVIINGKPCRDPKMGIGIFDIIALPKINKYYRILRDKNGRHVSIPIDAEAAKTRFCKVTNKTTVTGGKVQLEHAGRFQRPCRQHLQVRRFDRALA